MHSAMHKGDRPPPHYPIYRRLLCVMRIKPADIFSILQGAAKVPLPFPEITMRRTVFILRLRFLFEYRVGGSRLRNTDSSSIGLTRDDISSASTIYVSLNNED